VTASRSGAKGREGKVCGERGTASDGRSAVTQARGGWRFVLDCGCFRRREGFGGQNGRSGESGFRVGGNAANPRIGSPVQYPDRIRVVLNRRGGGKPRGRHMDGKWHSHSEGAATRRERSRGGVGPGVDTRLSDDGGAIFGQPQERRSGTGFFRGRGNPDGSDRSAGKDGAKVRRVERRPMNFGRSDPVGGPRRPRPEPRKRGGRKVTEGSGEASEPRRRSGVPPTVASSSKALVACGSEAAPSGVTSGPWRSGEPHTRTA